MTTDKFCFYLQNRLIHTSQTGGQQYTYTSPLSIHWLNYCENGAVAKRSSLPTTQKSLIITLLWRTSTRSFWKALAKRPTLVFCHFSSITVLASSASFLSRRIFPSGSSVPSLTSPSSSVWNGAPRKRRRPTEKLSNWCQCYKTFLRPQVTNFCNKLERLFLASFSSLV